MQAGFAWQGFGMLWWKLNGEPCVNLASFSIRPWCHWTGKKRYGSFHIGAAGAHPGADGTLLVYGTSNSVAQFVQYALARSSHGTETFGHWHDSPSYRIHCLKSAPGFAVLYCTNTSSQLILRCSIYLIIS